MKKIISANYRNRSSAFPWLIRNHGQDPREAVAVKSIEAKGVKLVKSSEYEEGFGCRMVAVAEEATFEGAEQQQSVDLYFSGDSLHEKGTDQPRREFETLTLGADRSMRGVVSNSLN